MYTQHAAPCACLYTHSPCFSYCVHACHKSSDVCLCGAFSGSTQRPMQVNKCTSMQL